MAAVICLVDAKGGRYLVNPGWNLVGSDPDCDIVLPGVEPKHLVLHLAGDTIMLRSVEEPMPENPLAPIHETRLLLKPTPKTSGETKSEPSIILEGKTLPPEPQPASPPLPPETFVNGKPASAGAKLAIGDRLRMNDVTLTLSPIENRHTTIGRLWRLKRVRLPVFAFAALAVVLILTVIIIHVYLDETRTENLLTDTFNGREVHIDNLSYSLFGFNAEVDSLTIKNLPEFSDEKPLLILDNASVDVPLFRAMLFKVNATMSGSIRSIYIERRKIQNEWAWNVANLIKPSPKKKPVSFPIRTGLRALVLNARQTIGEIEIRDGKTGTRLKLKEIAITAQQAALDEPAILDITGKIERVGVERGGEFSIKATSVYIDADGVIDLKKIRDVSLDVNVTGLPLPELLAIFGPAASDGSPWPGITLTLSGADSKPLSVTLKTLSAIIKNRHAGSRRYSDLELAYVSGGTFSAHAAFSSIDPPKGTVGISLDIPKVLYPVAEPAHAKPDTFHPKPLSLTSSGSISVDLSRPDAGRMTVTGSNVIHVQNPDGGKASLWTTRVDLSLTGLPWPDDIVHVDPAALLRKAAAVRTITRSLKTDAPASSVAPFVSSVDLAQFADSWLGYGLDPSRSINGGSIRISGDMLVNTLDDIRFRTRSRCHIVVNGIDTGVFQSRADFAARLNTATLFSGFQSTLAKIVSASRPIEAVRAVSELMLGRAALRRLMLNRCDAIWTYQTADGKPAAFPLLRVSGLGLERLSPDDVFPPGVIDLSKLKFSGEITCDISPEATQDLFLFLRVLLKDNTAYFPDGSHAAGTLRFQGDSLADCAVSMNLDAGLVSSTFMKARLPVSIGKNIGVSPKPGEPVTIRLTLDSANPTINLDGARPALPIIKSLAVTPVNVLLDGQKLLFSNGVSITDLDPNALLDDPAALKNTRFRINGGLIIRNDLLRRVIAYLTDVRPMIRQILKGVGASRSTAVDHFLSPAFLAKLKTIPDRYPYSVASNLSLDNDGQTLTAALTTHVNSVAGIVKNNPRIVPLNLNAKMVMESSLANAESHVPFKLKAKVTENALIDLCELVMVFDDVLADPPIGYLRGELRPKTDGLMKLAGQFNIRSLIGPATAIEASVELNTDPNAKRATINPDSLRISGLIKHLSWLNTASVNIDLTGVNRVAQAIRAFVARASSTGGAAGRNIDGTSRTAARLSGAQFALKIPAMLKGRMAFHIVDLSPGELIAALAATPIGRRRIPAFLAEGNSKMNVTVGGVVSAQGNLSAQGNAVSATLNMDLNKLAVSWLDNSPNATPYFVFPGTREPVDGTFSLDVRSRDGKVVIDKAVVRARAPGLSFKSTLTGDIINIPSGGVERGDTPPALHNVVMNTTGSADLKAIQTRMFPKFSPCGLQGRIDAAATWKRDRVILSDIGDIFPDVTVMIKGLGISPTALPNHSILFDADISISPAGATMKNAAVKLNLGTRAQVITGNVNIRPATIDGKTPALPDAVQTLAVTVTGRTASPDVLELNAVQGILTAAFRDAVSPYLHAVKTLLSAPVPSPEEDGGTAGPGNAAEGQASKSITGSQDNPRIGIVSLLNRFNRLKVDLALDIAGLRYDIPLKTTPVSIILKHIKGIITHDGGAGSATLGVVPEIRAGRYASVSPEPATMAVWWKITRAKATVHSEFDMSNVALKYPAADPIIDLPGKDITINYSEDTTITARDDGNDDVQSKTAIHIPGIPLELSANSRIGFDAAGRRAVLAVDAGLHTAGNPIRLQELATIIPILKKIRPAGDVRIALTAKGEDAVKGVSEKNLIVEGQLAVDKLSFSPESDASRRLIFNGEMTVTPTVISAPVFTITAQSAGKNKNPVFNTITFKGITITHADYDPVRNPDVRWVSGLRDMAVKKTIDRVGSDSVIVADNFLKVAGELRDDLLGKPDKAADTPQTDDSKRLSVEFLRRAGFQLKELYFKGVSLYKFRMDDIRGNAAFKSLRPTASVSGDFYGGKMAFKLDGDLSDAADIIRIRNMDLTGLDVNRLFTERFKKPDVITGILAFTGELQVHPALNFNVKRDIGNPGFRGHFTLSADHVVITRPDEFPVLKYLYKQTEIAAALGLQPGRPVPVSDGDIRITLKKGIVTINGPGVGLGGSDWNMVTAVDLTKSDVAKKVYAYTCTLRIQKGGGAIKTAYENAARAGGQAKKQMKAAGISDKAIGAFLADRERVAMNRLAAGTITITGRPGRSVPAISTSMIKDMSALTLETLKKVGQQILKYQSEKKLKSFLKNL